jgi:hypothetical protein
LSSDGEDTERTPEQVGDDAKSLRAIAFAVVTILVLALFVAILFQPEGCDQWRRPALDSPCEDQAPSECLVDTIEQASSSQFEHYVYCACVTVEGLSKGYVAASKRPASTQKLLEITGRDDG